MLLLDDEVVQSFLIRSSESLKPQVYVSIRNCTYLLYHCLAT